MGSTPETAMLGEIKRNLAVFAGQGTSWPCRPFTSRKATCPAAGPAGCRCRSTFRSSPSIRSRAAETDIEPAHRGSFAGLVGLVALRTLGRIARQLPQPREPKRAADPNKRLLVLVGAIAAMLFIAVMGIGLWQVNLKASAAQGLKNQKQELESEIAAHGDTVKRAGIVADWEHKNVCWLDELYDLTHVFPDPVGLPRL